MRVTLEATAGGDSQVNTFHYDLIDPSFPTRDNDPQTLADLFRDDVVPLWKTLYSSAWTIQPVVVTEEKDPQNPTAVRQQWTSGSAIAGTGTTAGDLLPPQCAVLVKLTTDQIGRRATGRMWLGGSVEEADQANGSWASGYITGIESIIAAIPRQPDLALGLSGASADWSVYSRTARAANVDPYAAPITGHATRTLVHTLRSRALYS